MPTLIIADDSELIRIEAKRILKREPAIKLLAEAETFQEAIRKSSEMRPEVLLLDLHMPDPRIAPLGYVRAQLAPLGLKIIAMSLSGSDDSETRNLAAALGACKVLEKARLERDLIASILEC